MLTSVRSCDAREQVQASVFRNRVDCIGGPQNSAAAVRGSKGLLLGRVVFKIPKNAGMHVLGLRWRRPKVYNTVVGSVFSRCL